MIVRPASAGDLTELRQHWPPSLLSGKTKRQVDMEAQRRECKCQFGNIRPGRCPHCGTYINTRLSRQELPSGSRSAVTVPDSMVLCVEGDRPELRGPSPSLTPRRLLCKGQHVGQVFPTLDGDTFGLDLCPQDHSVRDRYGCDVVQLTRCPARSLVPCVSHQSLRGSFMTKLSVFTAKLGRESRPDNPPLAW